MTFPEDVSRIAASVTAPTVTHTQAERWHHGYKTACGIYVGAEQYGSRTEPRTKPAGIEGNCPLCAAKAGR